MRVITGPRKSKLTKTGKFDLRKFKNSPNKKRRKKIRTSLNSSKNVAGSMRKMKELENSKNYSSYIKTMMQPPAPNTIREQF
jgi:hypothetical protein